MIDTRNNIKNSEGLKQNFREILNEYYKYSKLNIKMRT